MSTTREVAETFFALVGARDHAVAELFADEIHWYVPGEPVLPWAGPRTRKSEIEPFFRTLWSMTVPGETRIITAKLIVDGKDAVMLGQFSHVVAKTGKSFTIDMAFHLIVENGKIVHLHLYEDTLTAARAFELL